MQNENNADKMIVNSVTLGKLWGITDRRVRQLAEEGVIDPFGKGKYDLFECTKRYCNYLKTEANCGSDTTLDAEKLIHERLKREKTELTLSVMRGQLHKAEDVEMVMSDMLNRCKTKLRGIPAKASPFLVREQEATKIQSILVEYIDEALIELAEYDPKLFANKDMVVVEDEDDREEDL